MSDQARLTDRSVASITASLEEFGYPVTKAEVREVGDRLMAGQGERYPGDIIAKMVESMLREAGAVR